MLLSFGIKTYKINSVLNIQAFWIVAEPCRLINNYRRLDGSYIYIYIYKPQSLSQRALHFSCKFYLYTRVFLTIKTLYFTYTNIAD